MKRLAHILFPSLCLAAACAQASGADSALLGCWRADKIVLYSEDGSRAEDTSARCTLRFTLAQLESSCQTGTGVANTAYDYRVVRPQVYATTMKRSTFRTDLMGATREYRYEVDGDRLTTVTVPRPRAPGPGPQPAAGVPRVETEASRTACP